MSNKVASRFFVEYMYRSNGSSSHGHASTGGPVGQLGYGPMHSESAVLAFLRRKHPNADVTIKQVRWYNGMNEEV